MVKRTSLNLDLERVARAREVLGTNGTTETIHRALDEVVTTARLERLSERVFDVENDEIEAAWIREVDETS
jgi:Arc/MetJ family transcription regulator